MADATRADLVIGVGNPLMGDDGLGIAAVAALRERWNDTNELILMDGGTWGMNLLPMIEDARRVIIIDAIDRGRPSGEPITLQRDEIPRYFGLHLSPHQLDLREVLALAELRGTLPDETMAFGVQPDHVGLSTSLSRVVAERVPALLSTIEDQLLAWGHRPVRGAAAAA